MNIPYVLNNKLIIRQIYILYHLIKAIYLEKKKRYKLAFLYFLSQSNYRLNLIFSISI